MEGVEVVEIDGQGRIYLPSHVRSKLKHTKFKIRIQGDTLILTPVKPNIDKYYGIAGEAQYTKPNEIDEAIKHETKKIVEKNLHRR